MRIRCRSDLHREENIERRKVKAPAIVLSGMERKARERERERERERWGGGGEQKEQLYAHAEKENEIEDTQGGSGRGKSLRPPSGNDVRGLMLARTCVSPRASCTSCTKRTLSPATMLRGVVAENLARSAAAIFAGEFPAQVRTRSRRARSLSLSLSLSLSGLIGETLRDGGRFFHRKIQSFLPRGGYFGGVRRSDFRGVGSGGGGYSAGAVRRQLRRRNVTCGTIN